jgi:hypothetical protein
VFTFVDDVERIAGRLFRRGRGSAARPDEVTPSSSL